MALSPKSDNTTSYSDETTTKGQYDSSSESEATMDALFVPTKKARRMKPQKEGASGSMAP